MAYDSDTRVKELLKEVHKSSKVKILKPRFFAESKDDSILWNQGGLTFSYNNLLYGSNDFGWYKNEESIINGKKSKTKPVIIVEGTFGVSHGNIGSAQFARFSHSLGPVLNGVCGVTFQEYETTYNGKPAITKPIYILAALEVSKVGDTPFLVIDIDDSKQLIDLVKAFETDDSKTIKIEINNVLKKMTHFFNKYKHKIRTKLFADDGYSIKNLNFLNIYENNEKYTNIIKMMAFDIKAFTTSSGRNGHTTMGEMFVNSYCFPNSNTHLLLPRLSSDDLHTLKCLDNKELKLFFNHPRLNILTIENLIIEDKKLELIIKKSIKDMKNKIFKSKKEIIDKDFQNNKYYSTQEKNLNMNIISKAIIDGRIKINYEK